MPFLRSRFGLCLFFGLDFSAFLMSGKHLPEERQTPIGPNHIVFLLGPTQTSFSFPPAGTPEATSWEQGQMARPHMGPSRLFGATCEQKSGNSATVWTVRAARGAKIEDLRAENPRGTLPRPAPIVWYHSQPET